MADVMSPLQQPHTLSNGVEPRAEARQHTHAKPRLPPMSIPMPAGRNGQISLDVFSPVNQNGSFEFDRVLKSGHVYKRSRKTKQWKKFYLVLRTNFLSMYKNESEVKLLKQINLSDLTAVTGLKDPKGRRDYMFGLFTPSNNYHFQAGSDAEARSWVELIRNEAKIDEEEDSMIYGSPAVAGPGYQTFGQSMDLEEPTRIFDRLASSSPEPTETQSPVTNISGLSTAQPILNPKVPISRPRQQSLNEFDYSGQDQGSYSDFSDAAPGSLPRSSYNPPRTIPLRPMVNRSSSYNSNIATPVASVQPTQSGITQALQQGQQQPQNQHAANDQRVLWQGYLLCLKSKGGVRQWKRLWAVVRPTNLAFYKNEEEYSTQLLLPLPSILSAIEIDPLSRSKGHCMQIIAEEKNYRFCAESEEQLTRCLGAVKSLLARRKGGATAAGAGASLTTSTAGNPTPALTGTSTPSAVLASNADAVSANSNANANANANASTTATISAGGQM